MILGILKVAFPRFYSNITMQDAKATVALWTMMFHEDKKEDVELALQKLIATNTFPPTIAEVRQALNNTQQEESLDGGEAWGEVMKRIHTFGRYKEKEALEELTELTRKTVNCIGWSNLCDSENEVADRAHFMKIYNAIKKREMEKSLIPIDIQKKIQTKIETNKKEKQTLLNQKDSRKIIPIEAKQQNKKDVKSIKECIDSLWQSIGEKPKSENKEKKVIL